MWQYIDTISMYHNTILHQAKIPNAKHDTHHHIAIQEPILHHDIGHVCTVILIFNYFHGSMIELCCNTFRGTDLWYNSIFSNKFRSHVVSKQLIYASYQGK